MGVMETITCIVVQFEQRGDTYAQALVTPLDSSNPWWHLFEHAVAKTDGKLSPPEIHPSPTDARFIRAAGIPAFGFSPMSNTPILIHEHNEVRLDTETSNYEIWKDCLSIS